MTAARNPKTSLLAVACAAILLALPTAAHADGSDTARPGWSDTELGRMFERELDRVFDRLGEALESMPRYALPEVTEEGDIIIRRLPRRSEGWPPTVEDPETTIDL